MLPTHSPQVVVVRNAEFAVSYECCSGLTFAHTEVYRWSHTVARRMRACMDQLMALREGEPIYCYRHNPPRSWHNFVLLLGFERLIGHGVDGVECYRRAG